MDKKDIGSLEDYLYLYFISLNFYSIVNGFSLVPSPSDIWVSDVRFKTARRRLEVVTL